VRRFIQNIIFLLLILSTNMYGWKMEADKITVKATKNDTTTHINFRQTYDSVPLVFTLPSTQGGNPATLRVVNVSTTGFDIYTIEPKPQDGKHQKLTKIPYIAIEKGSHTLPGGNKIVAGVVSTKKFQSRLVSGSSWDSVSLSGFNTNPTILTEIQTRNNERTDENVPDSVSKPWLTVAVDNISSSGFNVALERSETADGNITENEDIAYLAIDSGLSGSSYFFADNLQHRVDYETILTDNKIKGWDDGGVKVNFSTTYDDPVAVAKKSSRNGDDGGWFRRKKIEDDGITLVVDEDRATDNERSHTEEKASILVFSKPFDTEFTEDSGARLLINEVMYRETKSNSNNDEFVELYVKEGGNIKDYILSDQDTNYYRFPSCSVSAGDYVIFHTGGDSSSNSCSGSVKHFYKGASPIWNNTKDDVLLIRPGDDAVTTTQASSPKTFNGVPQDYMAYGKKGSPVDEAPTSLRGVTLSWNYDYGDELDNADAGVSVALTPNANDSDKSACWEFTASGNASNNGCSYYLPTRDTNPDAALTYSMGENNNALPEMHITKTSIVINDPVNNTTHPKRIPGATIRYCFTIKNTGDGNADNATVHDTLDGDNRNKLTYVVSGKGALVPNTNDCSTSDCSGISDTSGSYDSGTKQVDIDLATPFPSDNHQCAYIEATIK